MSAHSQVTSPPATKTETAPEYRIIARVVRDDGQCLVTIQYGAHVDSVWTPVAPPWTDTYTLTVAQTDALIDPIATWYTQVESVRVT